MMTMRKGAMAIISRTHRFCYCWNSYEWRNLNLLHCFSGNLKAWNSQSLVQNVNRRSMSVAKPLPEADIKRFLKHLINAYANGESTEFDTLLERRPIKTLINERMKILGNIKSLEEFEEDKEMKKLAEEEKISYENQLKEIDDKLLNLILQNLNSENYDDVILDISAGVGGQESMLFVSDLLDMYFKHFSYLGYDYSIAGLDSSDQGGYRHASIMVSGKNCFQKLRHEAGVHRVQRVPATEKSGRIHTSVVSVAVLPQPNEIQVKINENDLKIDTMRASGAGGQHVNTTDSAIRITHLPTGIVVTCQENRSQLKNRKTALAKLRAVIYQQELDKQLKNASSLRKQQMGLGLRNEKIRTYNYNQDRVTDHRLSNGTLYGLHRFLEGGEGLNNFHTKLNEELSYKILLDAVKSVQ